MYAKKVYRISCRTAVKNVEAMKFNKLNRLYAAKNPNHILEITEWL